MKIFEELEFRRIISSLNSIFSINNEKNKSEPQKIREENNIDLTPGFGQFNLFENNIKAHDKGKLSVIYQHIESDVSVKLFLKKLDQQTEVSYHLYTEKNGDYETTLKSISFCWQNDVCYVCLLYTSPRPRDTTPSRMPSAA